MDGELLELMTAAAIEAGEAIMPIYEDRPDARRKPDGSPVTEADTLAEEIILRRLRPTGIPVLAEESASRGRIPELGQRFLCVDPLDGTREFLKHNGEFTVNIGLVEEGRPTGGVVYAPARGQLFRGGPYGAEEFTVRDGTLEDGHAIAVRSEGLMHIVASRSHASALLSRLWDDLGVAADLSLGSSLKFCLLARGDAQLYPRITPTCEWDTAAGQAVLEAAGGCMITLDGKPMSYGHAGRDFLNPPFAAAASQDLAERVAGHMRGLLHR